MIEDLIHKLIQKDTKTMSQVYWNNYPKALSFILKNNGQKEDAKDVFQEAMIALWQRISEKNFKPKTENELEAYLFQIVKYKWYDILKRKGKILKEQQNLVALSQHIDKEEHNATLQDKRKLIIRCLQLLIEPCKSIIKGFYYDKKSYKEMSKSTSYDAETLKTMKYRCMKKFKALVKNEQIKQNGRII